MQYVRKLMSQEYAAAMALVKRVFDKYVAPAYAQEGVDTFYRYIAQVGETVAATAADTPVLWGCFAGSTLIGVLAAKPDGEHINLLFVDDAYHRQGVARLLFEELLQYAAQCGQQAITVNASQYGIPAYTRLGFYPTDEEQLKDGIRFTPMVHYLQGFRLRSWRIQDAPLMQPLANDEQVSGNLRNAFPYPYTLEDAEAFIESCIRNEGKALNLCIELAGKPTGKPAGKPVGGIGIFPGNDVYKKSAEIGYWLGRPYWGRGIITEAIQRICRMAFIKMDIVRIQAEVFSTNPASCRALEKAGFAMEGIKRSSVYKRGKLLDSHVYALIRNESVL